MRVITLIGEEGDAVCEVCAVADRPLARLRGLLGQPSPGDGEGLLLEPCWSIHTCFLRYPVDAVFLDRDLRVIDVVADLKPWRFAMRHRADAVLELGAGAAARAGLRPGDQLGWGSHDEVQP